MPDSMDKSLRIMALMLVASSGAPTNVDFPLTPSERDDIAKKLDKEEKAAKAKAEEVEKNKKYLENLDKSIAALEKAAEALKAEVGDKTKDDPAYVEVQKILDAKKKLQEARRKEQDAAIKDSNLLKIEVNKILKEYFAKADPKMIAQRFGVDFDGIDFSGTPEFLKNTSAPSGVKLRYGLGAEHTWDDVIGDPWGWEPSMTMKTISQHEQVTTRNMYDMAQKLLEKKIPGIKPLIGRVGLTHNIDHLREKPDAYKNIFGNQSFTPSVLNNSTRWYNDIEKDPVFRELMDLYTRGKDTKTIKKDGAEITYGLPPIGQPILMNSGGNGGWNDRPNFTMQKNFYPYRLNIGATSQAAQKDANRRDDKAPVALDDYCSANYTDAMIQRPRWNADGSPVATQYVNPKYREIISDNLWRLAGKGNGKNYKGTPSETDLADEVMYPPALVKAVKADIDYFCKSVPANEGVDKDGYNRNLRGTSFAAPTAAGVMYAATVLFPDASEEECMSAFLMACEPRYHRLPGKDEAAVDDIMYMTDPKTGWCFSPRGGGYGEFIIRDDATDKNPDSWIKMQKYLELMRQERLKMTKNGKVKTFVEIGEGPEKRKVALDGQPTPVTMEITRFKQEEPSKAMKAETKKRYDALIEACTKSDMHACTSVIGSEIEELIKKHDYKGALKKYEEHYVEGGFVGKTDPFYEDIKKAVKEAEEGKSYTYSMKVPADHDLCCMIASLRLKYKDTSNTDRYIVLESPDGRMIPVTMSEPHSGIEVGSTSGFMNASALGKDKGGTWKIHTRAELDTSGSTLVLGGTERNPDLGILDVRETVLAKVVEKEAKARTTVPGKNHLVIKDPHVMLREWNGLAGKAKPIKLTPSTYEQQRDYMQELLNNSSLKKGGFLPKDITLRRPGIILPEAPKPAAPAIPFMDFFRKLFSGEKTSSLDTSNFYDSIKDNWGDMAVAIADDKPPKLDVPDKSLPNPYKDDSAYVIDKPVIIDPVQKLLRPVAVPDGDKLASAASGVSSYLDMADGAWVKPSQLPAKASDDKVKPSRKTAVS